MCCLHLINRYASLENATYEADVERRINRNLTDNLQYLASIAIGCGLLQFVVAQINFWCAPELYTKVEIASEAMLHRYGTSKA